MNRCKCYDVTTDIAVYQLYAPSIAEAIQITQELHPGCGVIRSVIQSPEWSDNEQ